MRRRRKSADWVYRSYKWEDSDPTEDEPFLSGTYSNPIQQISGQEAASALVLVDSHQYVAARLATGFDSGGLPIRYVVGSPATPESPAKGALVRGVDVLVHVHQNTASWFSTAVIHLGMRIVVAPQDPETGAMLNHPNYSMWENVGGHQTSGCDYWANGRQNCWEWRGSWNPATANAGSANSLNAWVRSRPRFRRRLSEDEGLFLWLEGHPNNNPSTIDLINPFCRTLVQPPD